MNGSEMIFTAVQPEIWRRVSDLESVLYEPPLAHDDSSALQDLLGVLAGIISYEQRFEDALGRHDYLSATYLLRRLPEPSQGESAERLKSALKQSWEKSASARDLLLEQTEHLLMRKDVTEAERQTLLSYRAEIAELSPPPLTTPKIDEILTRYQSDIRDWQGIIQHEVHQFNSRWVNERRWGFAQMQELLPLMAERILAQPGRPTDVNILLIALPRLILEGQREMLERIANVLINSQEPPPDLIEQLRTQLRIEPVLQKPAGFKLAPLVSPIPLLAMIRLSPIAHQVLGRAPPLNEPRYEDPSAFRAELNRLAQTTLAAEPIVELFASGAATLRQHQQPDMDVAARALAEEGRRVLLLGRYSLAVDLYHDSFELGMQATISEWGDPAGVPRAATGMATASFLLHFSARLSSAPIEHWLSTPRELFDAIVQTGQTDAVIAVWYRQTTRLSRVRFLEFIEDHAPAVQWRELLLLHVLRPRRLIADLSEGRDRLAVLLARGVPSTGLSRMLHEYLAALESGTSRDRISPRDLGIMRAALDAFDLGGLDNADSLARLVRDALGEHLEDFRRSSDVVRPRISLLASATPLTRILYPEELDNDPCTVIFSVRVNDRSEPATALVMELRVKDAGALKPRIEILDRAVVEVGAVESGEVREVAFQLRIDPTLVATVSQFTLETEIREGPRPLDRGRESHRFELRPRRPSLAQHSPFTPGKSLGKGDLFVGREHELRLLRDDLLGDGTEKIPLVIGIRRIGKTTIIRHLERDPEVLRRYHPCIYDLQDMPESRTTAELLTDLAERIRSAAKAASMGELPLHRAEFQVDPMGTFERFIMSTEQLEGSRKILVIFDEFEKLLANLERWNERQVQSLVPLRPETALIPETLAALRKAMLAAPRVSFVVCGVPRILHAFKSYDARMFGLMNPIRLQALDESAARKLIGSVKLYEITDSAKTRMVRMSGRQPYLLQILSHELFNHMKVSGRETATLTDVDSVIEQSVLPNELYWIDYASLVTDQRGLIRAVALAHQRLGPSRMYVPFELIYMLYNEQGGMLPRETVRQLLRDECRHPERPVIQQHPSNHAHFGLTVGLLIPILTRGA